MYREVTCSGLHHICAVHPAEDIRKSCGIIQPKDTDKAARAIFMMQSANEREISLQPFCIFMIHDTPKYQNGLYVPQKGDEGIGNSGSVLLYSTSWRCRPRKKEMNRSGEWFATWLVQCSGFCVLRSLMYLQETGHVDTVLRDKGTEQNWQLFKDTFFGAQETSTHMCNKQGK